MNDQVNWAPQELEDEVFRLVKEEMQLDGTFTVTTPLDEVGLDSLALVRVLVAIDNHIGVWLEGESLTPENLLDVRHLAACVGACVSN